LKESQVVNRLMLVRYNYTVVDEQSTARMTPPHPLPEPLVELIAQRFRVIAEPMRIRILDALRDGPMTIQELTDALGAGQQNVSKHVGVLAQAGVVAREKDGTRVRCSIADESVFELCEIVCGGLRQHVSELDRILGGATA
jgi:DNA-binding transcriptional ArsR family regulator